MKTAWQFVKQTGITLSEGLKQAWKSYKLKVKMQSEIVRFYFKKVDGTVREAWGTLQSNIINPYIKGNNDKAKNNTIQVYFDTEKMQFRSFKKFNLV